MHKSAVGYALGKLMQIMGAILFVPLGIAVWDYRDLALSAIFGRPEVFGFITAIIIGLAVGTLFVIWFREGRELQGIKEGYAIVTLGWISMAFLCAIPLFFYFMGTNGGGWGSLVRSFTDAYFEIMSGFTTTGATVLYNIETVPDSLLFLRALTHWLGGMGIITLALVIFPSMGVAAYQIFRGEVPGPTKDKLKPRLSQTVSILWGVYVLFTAAETILLIFGGMSLFDAVCHSFATLATGGFSTKNASVAAYSDYIQWVIVVFMYLAGVNFVLHFKALRGQMSTMLRDREFLFYNGVIVVCVILVTGVLYLFGPASVEHAARQYRYDPPTEQAFEQHHAEQNQPLNTLYGSFRLGAFQTVSIVTTTGFVTGDYDLWPDSLRFLLVLLMFFGGCAGSTGGGMKMIRIVIVFKVAVNVLRKLTQPRLVSPVRVGDQVLDNDAVLSVVSFFMLYVGLFVISGMLMTLFVDDLTTAVACSAATIGNIGPGLAGVGPVEHYGWIPVPGKWILVISMLLGRLEIFTVLIMLRPSVWRK